MKTAGLITEYNPFHNGHLYHINQTRKLTGADYIIVVMSGNFVQRGAPAIYDKYMRTDMALKAGADLVVELPAVFAVSSAEDFASCALALLDKLGVTDYLCFGSEAGEIRPLSSIADILIQEPYKYTEILKKELKSGQSFPTARSKAVSACMSDSVKKYRPSLLDTPNNILGIEYLKALKRRNSNIKPFTITREGNCYHDISLNGPLSSATSIRRFLAAANASTELSDLQKAVPEFAFGQMLSTPCVDLNDFSDMLNYTLLTMYEQSEPFSDYADISEDLAARISRYVLEFSSFEDRVTQLKTRQYTYTRICRGLLHLLLGIKASELSGYRMKDYASYARVLGFRRSSTLLLKQIKSNSAIPFITKLADAGNVVTESGMALLKKDIYCSHLYQSVVQRKYGTVPQNEYTHGCRIL